MWGGARYSLPSHLQLPQRAEGHKKRLSISFKEAPGELFMSTNCCLGSDSVKVKAAQESKGHQLGASMASNVEFDFNKKASQRRV